MEFRHLRCFLAVAEELYFARAAERLHIEQSPLSRAIKELEEDLGVVLFARTTRSTRLTRAGKLFFNHVPRVFAALQQARDSVKAAANGFHGQLRVALSDGITPSRLPALLALCRQEEPEVEIRLTEVPLSQQIKGLHDDLYDEGFARADEAGDGIVAMGPLPKLESTKLTFACPASLKTDLDRYAALHAQIYGEAVDATTLIPHMLEAFMAGDRGFRKGEAGKAVLPKPS